MPAGFCLHLKRPQVTVQTMPDQHNPSSASGLPDWRTLWDFDDPAGTEHRLRELRGKCVSAGDLPRALEINTQIARALGLQRRFDAAHALLDSIEGQRQPLPIGLTARIRLERGRIYNTAGDKARAVACFTAAWELANTSGDKPLALDAAHMNAIAAPPDEGLAWSSRAISLAESSDDARARRWLGPLYNNSGFTHLERGEFAQALVLFRKALEFRLLSGWTEETVIALWAVGHTQRRMGTHEEALRTMHEVVTRWREIGRDPSGYTHEEIAECLYALGRTEEARPYFARAHTSLLCEPWLARDEPERLQRLQRLAAG